MYMTNAIYCTLLSRTNIYNQLCINIYYMYNKLYILNKQIPYDIEHVNSVTLNRGLILKFDIHNCFMLKHDRMSRRLQVYFIKIDVFYFVHTDDLIWSTRIFAHCLRNSCHICVKEIINNEFLKQLLSLILNMKC